MQTIPDHSQSGEPVPRTSTFGASGWRTLRAALIGFVVGGAGATVYLALGGTCLFNVPRWAAVVFYPGFCAGFKAYAWGLSEGWSTVIGVITVGLTYAVVLVLANFISSLARRGREMTK